MKNLVLNNSKDIYAIPSQGCFYSPFNTSVGRMSHLLLINFEKDEYKLMAMISLGVAEEDTPNSPPRKPLDEVVTFID